MLSKFKTWKTLLTVGAFLVSAVTATSAIPAPPAHAASSSTTAAYSVKGSVPKVKAGGKFTSTVKVEVPDDMLLEDTNVLISLPRKATSVTCSVDIPTTDANGKPNEIATAELKKTEKTGRYFQLTLSPNTKSEAGNGIVNLKFTDIKIPTGTSSGDFKMTFEGEGSPFPTSKSLAIAKVPSTDDDSDDSDDSDEATVSLKMKKTSTFEDGDTISDIIVKESSAGSLVKNSKSLSIKLPSGFTWDIDDAYVDVNSGNMEEPELSLDSSEQTLYLNVSKKSSKASTLYITDLRVNADSDASEGAVTATISGKSTVSSKKLKIGTYSE
ncbi:hypothetical protein GJ688_13030 [Heliobacillus mobilis]|uniref:Uncharacterized protein n=1 Tax=Heliobacterium mobile TaxID=28064 RepID=A0A6I3SNS6_HELMO|nr:hypothetical protein [Heliobacterium mobile]MTV49897.1 hypothetical protein [Heliobacterium mobile]